MVPKPRPYQGNLANQTARSLWPLFPGIFYTAAVVGPAAGYLLGGLFLNMYTETHMT